MRILTVILFSLIILTGCKKEKIELCDGPNCEEYLEIWQNLFKSRNTISDDFFKEHVTVTESVIYTWNDGATFRVNYTVKIDWATIKTGDQFIIKIDPSAPPYPSLTVSRTDYLSETEINQVLNMQAFSSHMSMISPDTKLKFSTKHKALKALRDIADSKTIKENRIFYKEQKHAFYPNGHPYLQGIGVISEKENKCIDAEIDLITGVGEAHEGNCRVE